MGLKGHTHTHTHTHTHRKLESQLLHFPIGNRWNEKVKWCEEEKAAESSGWKAPKMR